MGIRVNSNHTPIQGKENDNPSKNSSTALQNFKLEKTRRIGVFITLKEENVAAK